jgi:hypothetical protein
MKSESVDLNKQTLQLHKRITELEQQLNEERGEGREKQLNEERAKGEKQLNEETAKGENKMLQFHDCVAKSYGGKYRHRDRPTDKRYTMGELLYGVDYSAIEICNRHIQWNAKTKQYDRKD